MKRLSVVCAVLALSLAGGSYSVQAETDGFPAKVKDGKKPHDGCGPAEEMKRGKHFEVLARILRLSEAQQSRVRGLFKDDHEESETLMKQLTENRKLLRQKMEATTFNEGEVRALAEKQGQLMARMIITPALLRQNMRTLLTPEQRDLEERIQPLLIHGAAPRPCSFGGEPPMGMEHPPRFQGEEFPPFMGKEIPPCCEDD